MSALPQWVSNLLSILRVCVCFVLFIMGVPPPPPRKCGEVKNSKEQPHPERQRTAQGSYQPSSDCWNRAFLRVELPARPRQTSTFHRAEYRRQDRPAMCVRLWVWECVSESESVREREWECVWEWECEWECVCFEILITLLSIMEKTFFKLFNKIPMICVWFTLWNESFSPWQTVSFLA